MTKVGGASVAVVASMALETTPVRLVEAGAHLGWRAAVAPRASPARASPAAAAALAAPAKVASPATAALAAATAAASAALVDTQTRGAFETHLSDGFRLQSRRLLLPEREEPLVGFAHQVHLGPPERLEVGIVEPQPCLVRHDERHVVHAPHGLKQRGVETVHGVLGQRAALLDRQVPQLVEEPLLEVGQEQHAFPFRVRATGSPPQAVHVLSGVRGHVELHHGRHPGVVHAPGGDVRGEQGQPAAVAELLGHLVALALGLARVHLQHAEFAGQLAEELCVVLRQPSCGEEHDGFVVRVALPGLLQRVVQVGGQRAVGADHAVLRDVLVRLLILADGVHEHGLGAHRVAGQRLHGAGKRGRK
mmetsp:Transcript_33814/g.95134  ORF Transcript_33814/g.95134 Transcript_33814/m.95134 type:complete len:362 (-) Transcript_33814:794-1879(-)